MAYDGELAVWEAQIRHQLPARAPLVIATPGLAFGRGEGVGLAIGAISIGALTGVALFFTLGRVAPWIPLAAALAAYSYALQLAGVSLLDVIRNLAPGAIALFALHLVALVAWPYLTITSAPDAWQNLLGLPVALVALVAFLSIARAPASSMHRTMAHATLVATVASYQWMWVSLGA